jgi:V/A-type H+-transporting ATPase subunit I
MLESQIEQTKSEILVEEEEIKSYEIYMDDICFLQDYDTMRAEKYEVISRLLQSNKVFVLTGYIPEVDASSLSEELNNRFAIATELEVPSEEEDVPVKLHNNGFSSPLEGVLNSFSPPGKGEIDPTMIMSLFYYFLFGLMLSDAGYGAIMAGACAFGLIKFKNKLENSMRKVLKMYLFCGISTIFWGIMFGSYFGDIVDVVSNTFFGNKITIPPLWFFPVNNPMKMLAFSMLIGIVHILTGLFIKLYQCIKQKDYASAMYDVIFWLVLVISSAFLLLSMDMVTGILGLTFKMPSIIATISGILAAASSIGIILTNGRESRNPFKRFLKGLYAFYGITGYLSDVLSYSRLLALGLATGIVASVINQMAGMVGSAGAIGVVIFIIIEIFGHTLNLGINALGAYVHTNRLHYVEFFGKFYDGGGRTFTPFSGKTKYYKIKE